MLHVRVVDLLQDILYGVAQRPVWVVALEGRTLTLGFNNAGARESFVNGRSDTLLQQVFIDLIGQDWRIDAIVDPAAQPGVEPPVTVTRPATKSRGWSHTDTAEWGSSPSPATCTWRSNSTGPRPSRATISARSRSGPENVSGRRSASVATGCIS